MKNRIREIRKQKGWTLERLSEASGLSTTYLSRLEKGERNLSSKAIFAISSALGVSPKALFEKPAEAYVCGYLMSGLEIVPIDDDKIEMIDIPCEITSHPRAIIVKSPYLLPVYRLGDIIIYDGKYSPLAAALGKECVVRLADDRMMLREVYPGSSHSTYNLLGWNAPPLFDQEIVWAAPVLYVKRKV